jgi:30S ribosomal protein S31
MGKGDKRTKRGKIAVGSFGKSRPKHKSKNSITQMKSTVKTTAKSTTKPASTKKKEKA